MDKPSHHQQQQRETTPADVACALELLQHGSAHAEIRTTLTERGLSVEKTDGLLGEVVLQAIRAEAVKLLNVGYSPWAAARRLAAKGCQLGRQRVVVDRQTASLIVGGILAQHQLSGSGGGAGRVVLKWIGGILWVVGLGLFLGHITGVFATYPFLGCIILIIGGVMWHAADQPQYTPDHPGPSK
jgi:hypothetical protein